MYPQSLKIICGGLLLITLVLGGLTPKATTAQSNPANFNHLIMITDGEPDTIQYNRITWDSPENLNPVLPGMSFLPDDWFQVSGDSLVMVVCADLELTSLVANGVVNCDDDPDHPAFTNMNTIDWSPEEIEVFVRDVDLPDGAGEVGTQPLDADSANFIGDAETTILGYGVIDELEGYILAMVYASHGLYGDAVNAVNNDRLQCTEDDPTVDVDADTGVYSAAPLYLRLGEWWAVLGNTEISARYLQCAIDSARGSILDYQTEALAYLRLAQLNNGDAENYQFALSAFKRIGATESIDAILEVCETCTEPE